MIFANQVELLTGIVEQLCFPTEVFSDISEIFKRSFSWNFITRLLFLACCSSYSIALVSSGFLKSSGFTDMSNTRILGQHSAMPTVIPIIRFWGRYFLPTISTYLPRQFICWPQNTFPAEVHSQYILLFHILKNFWWNYFWYKMIKINISKEVQLNLCSIFPILLFNELYLSNDS